MWRAKDLQDTAVNLDDYISLFEQTNARPTFMFAAQVAPEPLNEPIGLLATSANRTFLGGLTKAISWYERLQLDHGPIDRQLKHFHK